MHGYDQAVAVRARGQARAHDQPRVYRDDFVPSRSLEEQAAATRKRAVGVRISPRDGARRILVELVGNELPAAQPLNIPRPAARILPGTCSHFARRACRCPDAQHGLRRERAGPVKLPEVERTNGDGECRARASPLAELMTRIAAIGRKSFNPILI